MPERFCVTGKGVYPGDRLWNVEEAKPGTAVFFRDVYVKFDLDAVRWRCSLAGEEQEREGKQMTGADSAKL